MAIANRGRPPKANRPSFALPTDRIAFPKQLDILRAFAIASGPTGKAVAISDVAAIVKMVPQSVSMCNGFFCAVELLGKSNGSGFVPAPEVVSFNRAYEWNPDIAAHKLAPKIGATWFGERLLPKVDFRPMQIDEAISDLADAASAGPDYKSQLRLLLDYMAAAGLILMDENRVTASRSRPEACGEPSNGSPSTTTTTTSDPNQELCERREMLPAKISTSFVQPTEGTVQFHVSVKVNMSEMEHWRPDRIASFFGGIAQVLAAKGAIEDVRTEK